jgi:hypothetical protein
VIGVRKGIGLFIVRSLARLTGVSILLYFAGCAPQKNIVRERNLPLDQLVARVHSRSESIRTVTGNGSITIESPEESNSGSFDVELRKPDSMLVELRGPFGIHAATLSLSREQFVFFNRMNNEAIIGAPDGKTIQSMFHFTIQFDEILNAFTGDFPFAMDPDSLERFYVQDGLYVAIYKDHGMHREYKIDGDTNIIVHYRLLDSENQPVINAVASRPTEAGDIVVPRLLRVIFPKEHRSITVAYSDIHLNDSVSCAFTLPDNIDKIYK